MIKLRKGDYIPLTVQLHIFSYQHNSLYCLISKELANFGRDNCLFESKSKLPLTLILSSDILMEIFKDLLIRKMEIFVFLSFPKKWVYPNVICIAIRDKNLKAILWLETHIFLRKKIKIKWPKGCANIYQQILQFVHAKELQDTAV